MLKKIWKRLVYIEPGNIYPETFQEELDRQCYTIAFACGFIGFFAWIPYIPIDRIINPHIYIMPYLRLGLSTVCLIMLVIFFMPRFKNQGIIIINIGVAYLFVATGIITAISGAETSYVGGYILVIMLSVIVPLPKLHTYASLGVSLLTFFSICYISDTKFHTSTKRYSLNDLIIAIIITIVMVYILELVRRESYSKSKELEKQRNLVQRTNEQLHRDVTERQRAEEALRESEQRLSDIIDFLPDATFAIDRRGKVIAWNRAIEEMTGVKAEEMIGKGDYEYAIPFYGMRRPILIDLVFISDEEIEKKYRFINKKGDILLTEADVPLKNQHRILWGKARPLYDSAGNIVGAIESIRDITDRKHMEEALRESGEKYRSLASTADSMYLVDRSYRYLFMNEKHLSRFGIPLEKIIGRPYSEFHSEKTTREFVEIAERVFETGASTQSEHKSERDGRYFLRTFSPVKDQEGLVSISVTVAAKDITERKEAEEERERLILELKEALSKIRTLSGMLPICSSCKKIRDDKGYWEQIEIFISNHSEVDFSHSICPECAQVMYPEYYKKMFPEYDE